MDFRIDAIAGATPTQISDDIAAQLGPRGFSIRQERDGLHFSGDVTQAEVTTVLTAFAARQQARQDAAAAEDQERTTLREMVNALTTYIDLTATPNAAAIHAQTQRHARILRYLLRRL